MLWKPRRAGATSSFVLLHTMEFARSRWKTTDQEFRQCCKKRFSSLFSRPSHKERGWVWQSWRVGLRSLAASWTGRVPCGMGAARGSTSRCRWKKQKTGKQEKANDENHFDRGRRTCGEIRAAEGAGGQISDRGSGFCRSGARGVASRTARPGAAGRRAAGAGWTLVSAVDARAGKRSASADGFGPGHGENG